MKSLFWTLVKINAIAFLLVLGFALWAMNLRGEPSRPAAFFLVACVVYTAYLNIVAIVRARKAIAASIKDGAIEAAARAIEFKEAANARVQERLHERRVQERDRR